MLCMISLVIEFNVLSISSPNISLAVVKEKAPRRRELIFKASHRADAEPFLKVKSLHIRAFLMSKFTVAYFAIHAKYPKTLI